MTDRVDLLGDDLVHVQRVQATADVSLHDVIAPATEASPQAKGPCSICHTKQAAETCLHCHNVVCREHFWIMLGLCKSCATEEELRTAREGSNRPPPDLDIKWIGD